MPRCCLCARAPCASASASVYVCVCVCARTCVPVCGGTWCNRAVCVRVPCARALRVRFLCVRALGVPGRCVPARKGLMAMHAARPRAALRVGKASCCAMGRHHGAARCWMPQAFAKRWMPQALAKGRMPQVFAIGRTGRRWYPQRQNTCTCTVAVMWRNRMGPLGPGNWSACLCALSPTTRLHAPRSSACPPCACAASHAGSPDGLTLTRAHAHTHIHTHTCTHTEGPPVPCCGP